MLKEIIVAIISGAVIAISGYVFVVKENQIRIEFLVEQSKELKQSLKEIKGSVNSTNLFVTAAHPKGDLKLLQTSAKLKSLSIGEIGILGSALESGYFKGQGSNVLTEDAPEMVKALNAKHNFNKNDISNFHQIINTKKGAEL